MLSSRMRRDRGFTLIELLIVIALLGILAGILTPIMMRARFKAYHTACVQNERNLASALELYAIESENLYPADLDVLCDGAKPFIQSISTCPSNEASYATSYAPSADRTSYVLACPGVHELQLANMVADGYPQAVDGAIYLYASP